jgi:hypothetical protein
LADLLDHGRFRFTQRSDGAEWVGGQVRVVANEMRWTVAFTADWGRTVRRTAFR